MPARALMFTPSLINPPNPPSSFSSSPFASYSSTSSSLTIVSSSSRARAGYNEHVKPNDRMSALGDVRSGRGVGECRSSWVQGVSTHCWVLGRRRESAAGWEVLGGAPRVGVSVSTLRSSWVATVGMATPPSLWPLNWEPPLACFHQPLSFSPFFCF